MTAVDRLSLHGMSRGIHTFPAPRSDIGAEETSSLGGNVIGHMAHLRGPESVTTNDLNLNSNDEVNSEPKHGLAAMYEGLQMFRLLLFSKSDGKKIATAHHGRRLSALPESGPDLPVLPVLKSANNLRGSANRGGFDSHHITALDILFKPDKFNQLVTLFPIENMAVFIIFIVTMSVHIGVAILFFFHAYLVGTGQTTLEFNMNLQKPAPRGHEGRVRTMYDRGSLRENFEEVFGPYPVLFALLPSTRAVHNSEAYCQAEGSFSRNRARVDTGYGNLLDV